MSEAAELVSLRQHIEALLQAEREMATQRWNAHRETHEQLQQALALAREQVQAKLAEMNEVRRQINEERGVYATRAAVEGAVERLQLQVNATTRAADSIRTQLSLLAALIVVGLPILMYFWR